MMSKMGKYPTSNQQKGAALQNKQLHQFLNGLVNLEAF